MKKKIIKFGVYSILLFLIITAIFFVNNRETHKFKVISTGLTMEQTDFWAIIYKQIQKEMGIDTNIYISSFNVYMEDTIVKEFNMQIADNETIEYFYWDNYKNTLYVSVLNNVADTSENRYCKADTFFDILNTFKLNKFTKNLKGPSLQLVLHITNGNTNYTKEDTSADIYLVNLNNSFIRQIQDTLSYEKRTVSLYAISNNNLNINILDDLSY